jgi:hypothetical protein
MPKQLISIIGLIVTLGVVALAVLLVAVPMWVQSLAVDTQTASVANTNALYQVRVDALEAEKERQAEIDASVAQLRTQIPATNQLDDVFEVIGRAADSAGVTISTVTAGAPVGFVERTSAIEPGAEPEAPAPDESGTGEESTAPTADTGAGADQPATDAGAATSGRQQIDFAIIVTATDMAQATEFLDDLRSGPRLLSSITAGTSVTGTGVEVRVSALAFVDSEGASDSE